MKLIEYKVDEITFFGNKEYHLKKYNWFWGWELVKIFHSEDKCNQTVDELRKNPNCIVL